MQSRGLHWGKLVRVSPALYDFLHGVRQRIIEKIAKDPEADNILRPSLGRIVESSVREYARNHGVEPPKKGATA